MSSLLNPIAASETLKAARPITIKRFYYAHNLRRPEQLQARLAFMEQARALTTDPAILEVAVLQLRCLVEQGRVLHKHIAR